MRVVFLGTPEFAVPSLEALGSSGHDVLGVFTQPDRPKGRGNQISASPVKTAALRLDVSVHQPERIRQPHAIEQLRILAPDLMVVVGYGQISPQVIIDIPRYGILNVHASLLPKYRGAAPIQWAIANGETQTGVTIMQIDAGLDTGDMLKREATEIGSDETAPELSGRLADIGAKLLIKTITELPAGARAQKQNDAEATYAPILKKEDGRIDWQRPAQQIYNRLRGFKPWPGAYTVFRGQQLVIVSAKPASHATLPLASVLPEKKRLFVGCGEESVLEIFEMQPAGKKTVTAEAFLNGYKPTLEERFGD